MRIDAPGLHARDCNGVHPWDEREKRKLFYGCGFSPFKLTILPSSFGSGLGGSVGGGGETSGFSCLEDGVGGGVGGVTVCFGGSGVAMGSGVFGGMP